jgi:Sulfotransferase family
MALPTFFIIGAGKAGTTSLNYYLGLHPQIQMSAIKEPNFFAGAENGNPYPSGRISRLDEYERLFDPEVEMRGEASPAYTSHPIRQGAPEAIRELVPRARFIYLVRDPIARTVSHHQHLVAIGAERRSLREALGDLSNPSQLPETCYSLYASQLERYLRYFPQEATLVIDQSEFLTRRQSILCQVFNFLSVDDTFVSSQFDKELYKSSERRVYPTGYDRVVASVLAPATHWIPQGVRRTVRSSVERMLFRPLEAPVLDDELRSQLAALYAGEVERLRALTGKTFSTWSV